MRSLSLNLLKSPIDPKGDIMPETPNDPTPDEIAAYEQMRLIAQTIIECSMLHNLPIDDIFATIRPFCDEPLDDF